MGIFEAPKLDSLLSAIVVPNDVFDTALPRPRDVYAMVNVVGGVSDAATAVLASSHATDQVVKVET